MEALLERSGRSGEADKPESDGAKRCQILHGARAVFLARGFDGASMGEIARAAGVSKGTLYVYFTSKEALFEALILAERTSLAEAVFRLDESDPDLPAVLKRLGTSLLEVMLTADHVASARMVIGAAEKFPHFGEVFYEAGPLCGSRRLAAYLDRQVEAGRLAIDDTQVAAEQFFSLCSSTVLKRALFAGQLAECRAEIGRSVDSAVRVFFAAYGAPAQ